MKRTLFAIAVCAGLGLATSTAFAQASQAQAAPTSQEIQQKAMQDGPATGRIGYLTHAEPAAPKRARKPVDPRLLQPLTQREVGMLYNACIAHAECKTAYARAYEHNQALLRARQEQAKGGEGD